MFLKKKNKGDAIVWNKLTSIDQLDEIDTLSEGEVVMIFKHSTRCSISSSALNRVERSWESENITAPIPYYLDLISHRDISAAIADRYAVLHESPQVLLISKGKSIYDSSHMSINYNDIISAAN